MSENQLTSLPYWLGQLRELRTLDASGNQLTSLPYQLGDLLALQTLNISVEIASRLCPINV